MYKPNMDSQWEHMHAWDRNGDKEIERGNSNLDQSYNQCKHMSLCPLERLTTLINIYTTCSVYICPWKRLKTLINICTTCSVCLFEKG